MKGLGVMISGLTQAPQPLCLLVVPVRDSPPGNEAMEPNWGSPEQEPVGLGLLDPCSGLGLQ